MAYDGITLAAVVKELNDTLGGARIAKIAQPEKDALLLTVKTAAGQRRLLLSADASLPLVYLCTENRTGPASAPAFCMLLRKHIGSARILGFSQPGLERVLRMELEHYDEMGDLCRKTLVVEIMGKHSNIILLDDKGIIVDSITRVNGMVSSVREVLPGRTYFIVGAGEKKDPLTESRETFLAGAEGRTKDLCGALMSTYSGLSPMAAAELVRLSGVEERMNAAELLEDKAAADRLWNIFEKMMEKIRRGDFSPVIYYENGIPKEFAAVDTGFCGESKSFQSISALLEHYYTEKERLVRIRQRSADLRHIVNTNIERNAKKLRLQEKQLEDTKKREQLKLYGELLQAYAHQIPEGTAEYEALNYYDNSIVKIKLDPELSAMENAEDYFKRYQKEKRRFAALSGQTEAVERELSQLETIQLALDIARREEDLAQIRQELAEYGFLRRKSGEKKEKIRSRPLHYLTKDGFHIYVGRNNYQNDELTFRNAVGNDWWFHAKKVPGSHVLVKSEGRELPDKVFEQAAALAAFYSRAADQDKAEVDYLKRKDVKKPAGAAPGFVVYYTNYSMAVKPGIVDLEEVKEA
ncbi:MAG: NFACT family protein [Lachnospiraceae bacterium]|nr:NFACT family protein [Lachnospiraceae bacterium]